MRIRLLAAATLAGVAASGTQAASFGVFDARSVGMGNIGTSAGNPSNAAFYNPALLSAAQDNADFNIELPMVALRGVTANEDLAEDVGDIEDNADAIDGSITAFNNDPSPEAARTLSEDADRLDGSLQRVDANPLEAEVFGGAVFARPSTGIGWSFHIGSRTLGGMRVDYDDADQRDLQDYAGAMRVSADFTEAVEAGDTSGAREALETLESEYAGAEGVVTIDNYTDVDSDGDKEVTGNEAVSVNDRGELQSRGTVRGLMVNEIGIRLSREFTIADHDFAFGVTPKFMQVKTFDYTASAESDDFSVDDATTTEGAVNLDLGLAKKWDNGIRVGLTGKNLATQTHTTSAGNELELHPQFRAGVSHHTRVSTIGLDVDLTENDPVAPGFDRPSQYLALGGEFDAWNWMQVRAGYRTDLTGSYEDTVHAGIGLLHLVDVSAAFSDEEIQASARVGMRF